MVANELSDELRGTDENEPGRAPQYFRFFLRNLEKKKAKTSKNVTEILLENFDGYEGGQHPHKLLQTEFISIIIKLLMITLF